MKRDTVIEVILASVTASLIGSAFVILINSGFKSEDVFAFAGALAGAAGTVGGAAWLADRSASRARREEQTLISDELAILLDVAKPTLASYPDSGQWTDQWRSNIHATGDVAAGCGRFLDEVINHARTLDFSQRENIKVARADISWFIRFYQDVFGTEDELDPMDERTWTGVLKPMIAGVEIALGTMKTV